MNGAYLHLLTNHIPVIGMPIAVALLFIGRLRNYREVIRLSLGLIVVIAAITIVVDKTGGPAAHIVRDYPGVERAAIHEHAQGADYAFMFTEIAGGLALIGLWLYRGDHSAPRLIWVVWLVATFACTTLARVAHLGGLIRHPEIRSDTAPPPSDTKTSK